MYYQIIFLGADAPIRTKPLLYADEALYWANRAREVQPTSVSIVRAIIRADEDWLTQRLPQTTGPRTEQPGADVGVDV